MDEKLSGAKMIGQPLHPLQTLATMTHQQERIELAAAFRWVARLNMHEAVGNHLSLAVTKDGTKFLMNPNLVHFSLVKASDLLLIDANHPGSLKGPHSPDPSAWGLHGSIHRRCPHHRCLIHVHSIYATVLASLADSDLPPIDQNTAAFFNRIVIDNNYGGLAFENEGERCASMLFDHNKKVMIMGNHGVLIMGDNVAETFNRMYYFERAAETYIKALQTGRRLRILSHDIAEKVAQETESYRGFADQHLKNLMTILDNEGSNYAE
jgi:ribulose-5-phosphate 4-epimerase/fuculose-1-phosphate aldolase